MRKRNFRNSALWSVSLLSDLIFQFFIYLFLFPITLLFPLQAKKRKKKALLLVHGYCNFSWVWLFFVWELKNQYGPIYTINLGKPFSSIKEYAKKVESLLPLEENWILIGHSMGGLVASYAALGKYKGKIEKVITLGTPFSGTKLASWGFGECCKEMKRDSPFLQELKGALQKREFPIYSLVSRHDRVILPHTSALLPGGKEIEGIGHVGLLFSKAVLQQVMDWIEEKKDCKTSSEKL